MDKFLIEAIEDSPLSPDDKYNLLLLADNKRPGAWMLLGSQKWREGEQPKTIAKDLLDQVEETLQRAGLAYAIDRAVSDTGLSQSAHGRRRYWELAHIWVARDQATLKELRTARDHKDDKALGLLLGYPSTAVEAFVAGRRLPVSKLPVQAQLSEAAQFVEIMLSEDHWQAELDEIEKLSERVRELSPMIYNGYRNYCGRIDKELAEALRPGIIK